MDSDVTTIQRARGWRWFGARDDSQSCIGRRFFTTAPERNWRYSHEVSVACGDAHEPPWAISPDPLADTPEGWWEFGQIIKWAHEKGWAFVLEIAVHHYCAVVNGAAGWMGNGYGDFRTAIIAALAEAVRRESEAEG